MPDAANILWLPARGAMGDVWDMLLVSVFGFAALGLVISVTSDASARSVASVAMDLAERTVEFADARVVLVGTGQLAASGVHALTARGANIIGVFSPSGRARDFGELYGIEPLGLVHKTLTIWLPLQDAVRLLPNLRSLPGAVIVIALVHLATAAGAHSARFDIARETAIAAYAAL